MTRYLFHLRAKKQPGRCRVPFPVLPRCRWPPPSPSRRDQDGYGIISQRQAFSPPRFFSPFPAVLLNCLSFPLFSCPSCEKQSLQEGVCGRSIPPPYLIRSGFQILLLFLLLKKIILRQVNGLGNLPFSFSFFFLRAECWQLPFNFFFFFPPPLLRMDEQ